MSADAGVPTFRGHQGLWGDVDPEIYASLDGFLAEPDKVWEWYRQRRFEIASVEPHPGQRSLALLQRFSPEAMQVLVATTNEDDLLERAGLESVIQLHGSLFTTRCLDSCGWEVSDDADNAWSLRDCPRCGARTRPGSIWFGEKLDPELTQALEDFAADGCLVVGSSSVVQPIAAIPPEMALAGLPVVEVNIARTPLSDSVTVHLQGSAASILPHLVDQLTSAVIRAQQHTLNSSVEQAS
ncbi:MAG: NAD-dependent deacylase [Planctomycetota bacterium]|nr:MAG: NAD-dependent deacylase [Planctomycetota bacterium]